MNKLLLEGDKFIYKMHLRQHRFIHCESNSFTKNKERIQKFKETGGSRYICQNELGKACFQYDMANGDFKDMTSRTASDKILNDKAFNIVKDSKYHGYGRDLASMAYSCFDKKISGGSIKNENMLNKELAKLHKPVIRIFEKKLNSPFKDNIWGTNLVDI